MTNKQAKKSLQKNLDRFQKDGERREIMITCCERKKNPNMITKEQIVELLSLMKNRGWKREEKIWGQCYKISCT